MDTMDKLDILPFFGNDERAKLYIKYFIDPSTLEIYKEADLNSYALGIINPINYKDGTIKGVEDFFEQLGRYHKYVNTDKNGRDEFIKNIFVNWDKYNAITRRFYDKYVTVYTDPTGEKNIKINNVYKLTLKPRRPKSTTKSTLIPPKSTIKSTLMPPKSTLSDLGAEQRKILKETIKQIGKDNSYINIYSEIYEYFINNYGEDKKKDIIGKVSFIKENNLLTNKINLLEGALFTLSYINNIPPNIDTVNINSYIKNYIKDVLFIVTSINTIYNEINNDIIIENVKKDLYNINERLDFLYSEVNKLFKYLISLPQFSSYALKTKLPNTEATGLASKPLLPIPVTPIPITPIPTKTPFSTLMDEIKGKPTLKKIDKKYLEDLEDSEKIKQKYIESKKKEIPEDYKGLKDLIDKMKFPIDDTIEEVESPEWDGAGGYYDSYRLGYTSTIPYTSSTKKIFEGLNLSFLLKSIFKNIKDDKFIPMDEKIFDFYGKTVWYRSRDKERKLYKLDDDGNKIYADTYLGSSDTCYGTNYSTNLDNCNDFIFKCIYKKDIDEKYCIDKLGETDFNEKSKKEIKNLSPQNVLQLLKNLDFRIINVYDIEAKRNLNKIDSIDIWLQRKNITNIDNKTENMKRYLSYLVDFINSEPNILNKDYFGNTEEKIGMRSDSSNIKYDKNKMGLTSIYDVEKNSRTFNNLIYNFSKARPISRNNDYRTLVEETLDELQKLKVSISPDLKESIYKNLNLKYKMDTQISKNIMYLCAYSLMLEDEKLYGKEILEEKDINNIIQANAKLFKGKQTIQEKILYNINSLKRKANQREFINIDELFEL